MSYILGLAGASADLRKEEIDTEWGVLVVQVLLQLVDLLPQHLGGVANTSNNTQSTSVGNSGSQLGASSHVHTSQQNWVVDLEQISNRGTDNL